MKKLFLHVGFPKTGTTSIQKFFYENGCYNGVEYLESKEDRHRKFWAALLFELGETNNPKVKKYNLYKGSCYDLTLSYISQINKSSNSRFLLSFEGLISLANKDSHGLLEDCIRMFRLAGVFVTAIVYVRPVQSYWVSRYLSEAKSKPVGIFSDYIIRQLYKQPTYKKVINYFHYVCEDVIVDIFCDKKRVDGILPSFVENVSGNKVSDHLGRLSLSRHNTAKGIEDLDKLRIKKSLPPLRCLVNEDAFKVKNLFSENHEIIDVVNKENAEVFNKYFLSPVDLINVEWVVDVQKKINMLN